MVQSINSRAILALATLIRNPDLLVPQITVSTISELNYTKLKEAGCAAVIFDKDNTLTAPYENQVHPRAVIGLDHALRVFGRDRVAILSNSAGTRDDVDYKDAIEIEEKMGLAVIRHDEKKPGGLEEVLRHFQLTDSSSLCMVGDRILTDIVFGNMHNMVTIHCLPLCTGSENAKDNWTAKLLRPMENKFVLSDWYGGRYLAKQRHQHPLLQDSSISFLVQPDDCSVTGR
jgi:phosphatidylglycerophosphatase GEP4